MSDVERLEQFRAVMLNTMNIVREMRKDIVKLQAHVLAIRNSFTVIAPDYEAHFQVVLASVEKSLNNQRSDLEKQLDRTLDEVIGMLDLGQKPKLN